MTKSRLWHLVIASVLLLGAACAGSKGPSSKATPSAEDREQALLDFTECMREQGIEMSDPVADSEGNLRLAPSSNFQDLNEDELAARTKARQVCSEESGSPFQQFSEADRTQFQDQLLAFAGCMREHGVDMPDPDFSSGPGGFGTFFRGTNTDDPDVAEAREACQDTFGGQGGPFGGRAPGSGTGDR